MLQTNNFNLTFDEPSNSGVAIISEPGGFLRNSVGETVAGPYDISIPSGISARANFTGITDVNIGWCRVGDNGKNLEWNNFFENGKKKSVIVNSSGRYYLLRDCVSPNLGDLHVKGADSVRSLLGINVSDGMSGIDKDSLKVTVDNRNARVVYFENDGLIEIDSSLMLTCGSRLEVELSDFAGNTARATLIADSSFASPVSRVEAFPNPCRNNVNIAMKFARALIVDSAEVKIYDIAGHQVVKIPMTQSSSSEIYIDWDLTNKRHQQVANGVYFYRITCKAEGRKFKSRGKIAVLR